MNLKVVWRDENVFWGWWSLASLVPTGWGDAPPCRRGITTSHLWMSVFPELRLWNWFWISENDFENWKINWDCESVFGFLKNNSEFKKINWGCESGFGFLKNDSEFLKMILRIEKINWDCESGFGFLKSDFENWKNKLRLWIWFLISEK